MSGGALSQGVVIRVTPISAAGVPDTARAVVSNGFTQVQSAVQTEAGTTTTVRNAAGGICFTKSTPDQTTGTQLTIDFCKVDPCLFDIVSSARPVANCDGVVAGMQQGLTGTPGSYMLEIWAEVAKSDKAELGGAWMYTVFPSVDKGTLGGTITWSDAVQTYQLVSNAGPNPSYDAGPYGVLQAAGSTAVVPAPAHPYTPSATAVALCDFVDDDAFVYSIATYVEPPKPNDEACHGGGTTLEGVAADKTGYAAYAGDTTNFKDLAAIKGDATVGDGHYTGKAFAAGDYVRLHDKSQAYYDAAGSAWTAGAMP